MKTKKKNKR